MLVRERKEMLRKACSDLLLARVGSEEFRLANRRAQDNLLSALPPGRGMALAIYNAVRGEVETEVIREVSLAAGAKVYYPCVNGPGEMSFFPYREGDAWVKGAYGIPEPVCLPGLSPKQDGFDFVLVPGLAFDRKGGRLGKGIGYYDRFLGRISAGTLFVGFACSEQIVPEVPLDEWDAKMHMIVTEEGVIRCSCDAGNP
ncbi:MAG: 5-formyltetrahydrofolate cyclo-ligase [Syntrophorhabdaceae bacterium]|nr:5-formyltetrahydrofolate cyclo-ligase [Syntrophorhabdaceae bacterium]